MRTFIQEPKNQEFDGGFSITMDCYDHNAQSGNRDRFVERKTVRFPRADLLSDFYDNNRKIVIKKKEEVEQLTPIETALLGALVAAVLEPSPN
jgi:hypothetical protein